MRRYVVRQGDYLARLAMRKGFDADAAWGHVSNRELCERRADGNVLAPGDVVHLPEPQVTSRDLRVAEINHYRVRVPTVPIRVVLGGPRSPLVGEPYAVYGLPAPLSGSSDEWGLVLLDVPTTTHELTLVLPRQGYSIRLLIGHLDPLDGSSGVEARLQNLGYLLPTRMLRGRARRTAAGDRDGALVHALRAFQFDQGLQATGELDDETARRLLNQHGA